MQVASAQTPARQGRWTKKERRAQVAAVTLEIIAREGVPGDHPGAHRRGRRYRYSFSLQSLLRPDRDTRSRHGSAARTCARVA